MRKIAFFIIIFLCASCSTQQAKEILTSLFSDSKKLVDEIGPINNNETEYVEDDVGEQNNIQYEQQYNLNAKVEELEEKIVKLEQQNEELRRASEEEKPEVERNQTLVVFPTKMNIFYIGPDNPVDISVPGVPGDKISASLTPSDKGSITKNAGGGYIVRVKQAGKCNVSVVADINGKKQNMGSVEFRIKRVPDPVPEVLGMSGGDIDKARLQAAMTVDVKMKDFDFDLSFKVTSFTIRAQVGSDILSETIKSNRINQQVNQNIFSKVEKGSIVYFEDIKAVGPDGKPRNLGTLKFVVK